MDKKEKRLQRLEQLRKLSAQILPAVKDGTFTNVNTGLIALYSCDGHTEFHTFNEWKKRGYKIVKGCEGFPVWGKPKQRTVTSETGEDREDDFYPMSYLFSNLQVIEGGRP